MSVLLFVALSHKPTYKTDTMKIDKEQQLLLSQNWKRDKYVACIREKSNIAHFMTKIISHFGYTNINLADYRLVN